MEAQETSPQKTEEMPPVVKEEAPEVKENDPPSTSFKDDKEKVVFPPAATWYKTNATTSRDDMWAYLAGQSIVLVKPKITHTIVNPEISSKVEGPSSDRVWPKFEIFGYQREHYNCISFCQSSWDFLPVKNAPLVTGCKEGYVRIWDVTSGECVLYYDLHRSDNKNVAVTCLDWSVADPKVIYSMDEEGTLVSIYLPKAKLKSTTFGKISPTSLHASPHEANIIAFGTKGGIIFIAQTDPKGKSGVRILHKVRHDEEIVSTLWCPKLGWRLNQAEANAPDNKTRGAILASSIQSVKAPTIRLWSRIAEDRGIYHVWDRERQNRPFRNFSPLLWAIDPNAGVPLLVTSSRQGQIVFYTRDSTVPEVLHDIHTHSSIFGLVQCGDILWSTSYEPVIVGFNLRTMQVSCVIPTFRGVCSIAPSLSAGSFTALGGADACIRILNFDDDYPVKTAVKSPYLSNRMRSKIMALAWHPTRDNILGFGTDDGILGTYEVRENQKQIVHFDHRIGGVVYSVDWGPSVSYKDKAPMSIGEKSDSLSLYGCGGNSVFSIHPSKISNPLINVSKIIEKTNLKSTRISGLDNTAISVVTKASDIRWSSDFALFAVGFSDGRVELYTPPFLQLKCWIKCHSRAIQFMSWRISDFLESKINPEHKHRWFATTSNDATVRLFNLESIFEKEFLENETEEPKLLITSQAKLSSPSDLRIISCAWSPHDPNLLVTVSYDSTAIIWNITDGVVGVPIARYFGHSHRLVACAFHPRNKYQVITASDELMHDSAVHVWDYRMHPYCEEICTVPKLAEKANPLYIKGKDQDLDAKNENDMEDDIVVKRNPVKDTSSRVHFVGKPVVKGLEPSPTKPAGAGKKSNPRIRSIMSSSANVFTNSKYSLENELRYLMGPSEYQKSENGGATNGNGVTNGKKENGNGKLDDAETDSEDDENSDAKVDKSMTHLGLLAGYGPCVKLMKAECESHAEKGSWEKGCLLASWMNDSKFIEKAIDDGHITETIVHLTKSMSHELYAKACKMYAQKLVSQDDIFKAATYLLQGGLKKEAIELLLEHKFYRDAVALVVTNMTAKDPMRAEIYRKWLLQLIQDGNFEVAAKVYCSLGMHKDALAVIEKRDLPYAWKAGMLLADHCGDEKKLQLLGFTYCVNCMMKKSHEEAKQTIMNYNGLKWLLPFLLAHETIFHISNGMRDASASGKQVPNVNFREIIVNQLDLDGLNKDGLADTLKDTILISITQNRSDAEVILVRTLLMKLLGGPTSQSCTGQEDYIKLCETWLKDKDPHTYTAYINALDSLC